METKRLYRSVKNKVICGVCGGIGEYFNVDPVIIRLHMGDSDVLPAMASYVPFVCGIFPHRRKLGRLFHRGSH